MVRILFHDYEYNQTAEPKLNLVCMSGVIWQSDIDMLEPNKGFWFHKNPEDIAKAIKYFEGAHKEKCFLASFNVVAEARAMLSLGLNPLDYQWIDLFVEWRMLKNHNHEFLYGTQLIDGKIVETEPPRQKYQRSEEENSEANSMKAEDNLAAAIFKLLGTRIDTDLKNLAREIIIENDPYRIETNRKMILEYCMEDVEHLPALWRKIVSHYTRLMGDKITLKQILERGKFQVVTALQEHRGYPIDYTATRNFSNNVPHIMSALCRDINSQFPMFNYKKLTGSFSWDQKGTKQWIETLPSPIVESWMKTDSGALSLSLEAFTKHFNFKHTYPRNNRGAQIVRYLKTKQSLNGFSTKPDAKKRSFWDYVGSDQRVRPYLNSFKSQSSRNQPSSTSFMFLKAAWMRALVDCPDGYSLGGIDYASEEFLIAGLESGDLEMIQAYESGDPYIYYGKKSGVLPPDATKESHSEERDALKVVALMNQYGAQKNAIAASLSEIKKAYVSPEEAQEYINLFFDVFWGYKEYIEECKERYRQDGYLQLRDGWVMFGDNNNPLSVSNCAVQGMGAVIMRKMCILAEERGLHFLFPNHDAGYIMFKSSQLGDMDTLADCMQEAFRFYYRGTGVEKYANIRLDGNIWGPNCTEGKVITPAGWSVKSQRRYIDKRSIDEYNQFKEYFEDHSSLL